jgi:carboxymethylenebutenolidase
LTRRQLLVTGAAAAGYALAARPLRAEAIATPSDGLLAGMVEVPAAGGPMPAYRARPEGDDARPVVLVVHEIFGVHEYVRDVCRRLARQGYLALAPDLYRRQGDVSALANVDQIVEQVVSRVPDAQVLADLDAALSWARQNGGDPERAAVIGFCWGGRVVWLYAAHQPGLKAAAAWYGRLEGPVREQTPKHPIDLADEPLAPVLGLYAGEDSGIPLESVFRMRKELAAQQQKSEILIFPTAPHGFHADYRESYRPMDAQEGWRRMLEWFRRWGLDTGEAPAPSGADAPRDPA